MARLNASLYPKLTDSVISIFESKKIYTVFDLVLEDSEKIMQYSGLTYQEILDLKHKITRLYIGGMKKGSEMLETSYENVTRTGINSLDNLLKGGLRGGEIYEICGVSSSGKSQLCHTVAVNIAGELNGIVHYIDTNGDFSAKRTHAISKSKTLNEDRQRSILDNVTVTKIERSEQLMKFLYTMIRELKMKRKREKNKLTKLVIIDSLPVLFFNCEIGSAGNGYSYQAYTSCLNNFANVLRCVANELNIPIITINLISEWRDNSSIAINGSKCWLNRKPGLGRYWLSIPNTRLFIETMKSQERKITVWKSSHLSSDSCCLVSITNSGME